ncbi:MAG: iron ABC transporter permease [Bacteroidota bacterium]|nr:iron ABC transporter permease [Bacteroidota bacterium]
MNSEKRLAPASVVLLFLVIFFAAGYILFPLVRLLKQSVQPAGVIFSFHAYMDVLRSTFVEAAFNSVAISLLSVLGSALIGSFLAYVFHSFDFPLKTISSKLVLVPLALPPLVGVISFMFLIGESGILTRGIATLLSIAPSHFALEGWWGIVAVHVYSFNVYFYVFVSSALSQLSESHGSAIDASLSLGASRASTIRRIVLPMLTPSFIGASLVTFMASMASFSAPFLFGGTTRYLTLEIYTAKLNGNDANAAAFAVLLSIVSVSFLLLLRWYQGRKSYVLVSKGSGRRSTVPHSPVVRLFAVAAAMVLVILLSLPVIIIVVLSFVKEGSWTYQILPHSFTVQNFVKLFGDPRVFKPIANSVEMALTATVIVVFIGVCASFLVVRKKFIGKRFLELMMNVPFGIPGTVIAVGLILSFNHPSFFSAQSILIGTFWILPLAYAVRNLPILFRSTSSGLEGLDPGVEEAAWILGSSGWQTLRRITFPLLLSSLVSGALLVFINSLGEFVSSILLYSYDTKPISVEILSQLRLYNVGGAAAYCTLLMILVMVAVGISSKISRVTLAE